MVLHTCKIIYREEEEKREEVMRVKLACLAGTVLAVLVLFAAVALADNVYCNGLSWVGDEHPLTTTWTQVAVSGTAPSVSRGANSTLSWIQFSTSSSSGTVVYAAPSSATVTLPYPFTSATFLFRVFIADSGIGGAQYRHFYIGLFNGTHFVFADFYYTTSVYITVCTSTLSCTSTGVSITSVASTWITINMTVSGSTLYLSIPERGVTVSYAPAGYFPSFFAKGVRLAVGAYGYTAYASIGTVYVDWLRAAAGRSPPTASLVSSSSIQGLTVANRGPAGFGNSTKCFAVNLFNAWVPSPAPTPPLVFVDNPPHAYALNATVPSDTMAISDIASRFLIYAPTATVFSNIPITVNSTVIEAAPELFSTRATLLILPPSSRASISFIVNDYGQGYTHLIAKDLFGRLVAVRQLSAADRSAVVNLTAYQSYVLTLWKPSEERVLGPVTVSQTQYYLNVPVPPPSWQPAPLYASAFYNATAGAYVVDVTCRNPPCTVTLVKKWVTEPQVVVQEVELQPGTALAPHLFTWYFDGVDDYVFLGLQPDGTGKPLVVYGWSEITIADRWYWFSLYRARFGRIGVPGYPSITAGTENTFGLVQLIVCAVPGSSCNFDYRWTHAHDYYLGKWGTAVRQLTLDSRVFTVWANSVRVYTATVSPGEVTFLEYNTTSPFWRRYSLGAQPDGGDPHRMLQSYVAIWRRAISSDEIAALEQYVINAAQLEAFFDPTWYNGTHYVSLTGGYVGKGYNGVARLPANETWIWVIHNLHTDGRVHLRFMKGFTVVLSALDSGATHTFTPDSDDYAVSLPPGRYKLTVYVSGLKVEREEARYVCGEQRCRITWYTSDPTLEVSVEDAAGYVFTAVTGAAVGAQSWLRDIISTFVAETGLSILGGEKFLLIFAALIIFILLSSAYEWRAGAIAAAVFLTAVQAWTGFDVVSGTVTAILFALVVLDIIADWL
ncbi:MAG: hypothetical protein QXT28_09125 [Thermofilaceae archaeon]